LYFPVSFSDMPSVEASGSNSSLMDPEDMLQAVESDESLWQTTPYFNLENL